MTYVVLGASGHVGAAVVAALRSAGESVLAVVHDPSKAAPLEAQGAEVAVVDVGDPGALHAVIARGTRAFLLNPPADIGGDTDAAELGTARAIGAALREAGLEKVVVASTYGAQPGDAIGDLSTLCKFERLVSANGIPTATNRGAYYFTNFDQLLEPAKQGTLPTMFPADMALPMVAPADLGAAAARRLRSGVDDVGVHYVEGPRRYSFNDVAAIFSTVLGLQITVATIPREGWEAAYREQGFSDAAARAYVRMTAATIDQGPASPDDPERGSTTLDQHIRALVAG
ncbi:MAG: NmrA family NAD(P)-binding protein [Pseudomonadota bacterium]